jgi:glycerol-3-phosphate acyltransferase PlsY
MLEAVLLIGAYLVGAVPFGYLIARAHGVNIFEVGSGNVGATNIKRALGLGWALAVFALDVLKGAVPALLALQLLHSQAWAMGAGCAAIAGHCLSPFLKFRGGKGIATALGVALASSPLVALSAFGVFVVCLAISRYVSLSSMIAVPSGLLFGWLYGESRAIMLFYGALAVFVIVRHRANIKRLRDGTEPKFSLGQGKDEKKRDEPEDQNENDMSYRSYKTYESFKGGTRA